MIINGKIFDIQSTSGERWHSPQFPEIYVKRIAATRNAATGDLLLTLEMRLHRWVLAEFNTHRVLSRNSASSRAIPVEKRLADVRVRQACPVVWASEQRGMQGGEVIEDNRLELIQDIWAAAARDAASAADALQQLGAHKSIVNRLLEPFLYHTAVVTGTEWSGFIEQRNSELAQPEIHLLAALVAAAVEDVPSGIDRVIGEWHLPYIDTERDSALLGLCYDRWVDRGFTQLDALARMSAARCARVSYLTHDGKRDAAKDLELYDKLVAAKPMHASPLEHVAMAVSREQRAAWPGNLHGFAQLRHFVEAGINPFAPSRFAR